MKHLTKALFAFLLMPLFSLAQSNYKPGYVVTLKGDTLRGYIDYKEWDRNPTKINFKNNLNTNDVVSYSVKNAAAFTVNKLESYQCFIVSVSQDVVEETKLETKLDTSKITDTVFLRICTAGKHIAIYSYTDKIKERFYCLETGNTAPEELGFHAFLDQEESTSVQYIRRYRTQLENMAQKYKVNDNATLTNIVRADYTEPAMIKMAHAINGPSSSVEFTQQNIAGARWFIGLGATYNQLKFQGTSSPFGVNSSTNSTLPKFEAGLDFFPNKTVQRFSIRFEYSFQASQFKNLTGTAYSNIPGTNSLSFTQYNNSLSPQIILNLYNKESFKFFIGAGLAINASTYNHYQTITTFGSSFNPTIQNNFPAFEKLWISFPLSAGISINKKVELNFRYIPASPITDYAEYKGAVTSYQFGLNYLFGK